MDERSGIPRRHGVHRQGYPLDDLDVVRLRSRAAAALGLAHGIERPYRQICDSWIARNAGHMTAYDVHPDEWEERVSCAFSTTASAEVSPMGAT